MRILDAQSTDCYVVTLEVNGDELAQLRYGQNPLGPPKTTQDLLPPVPDNARRALLGLWDDAFPKDGPGVAQDFTRRVLGGPVSWDDLTYDQYRTLRDALIGVRVARDYLT
jgi:hypothetical protein